MPDQEPSLSAVVVSRVSDVSREASAIRAEAEATPVTKRGRGRPKVPKHPHYPDFVQEVIRDFLNARRAQAVKAVEAAELLEIASSGLRKGSPDGEYWRRILSAIDWIAWFVDKRQTHLPVIEE